MRKSTFLFTSLLLLTLNLELHAQERTENLDGVSLSSSKVDASRTYSGKVTKSFPYPLDIVKQAITNFSDRCNNSFKSKRQFISEEQDCKFHHEHLIETFVVKDIRPQEAYKNLTEYYLLGRQVYNRGSYGYYELVQVQDSINAKKQRTTDITLTMLNDEEVKAFVTPKFSKDTAFDTSVSRYTLIEITPTETQLSYEFTSKTDHWLLNKEVSVPQVFSSISKTMNNLMVSLEEGAGSMKREVASEE